MKKQKKYGYKLVDNEQKVKDAYIAGFKTAYKISKETGLHFTTVQNIMAKLGLINQARNHKNHIGIYVHTDARGTQVVYIFGSIYRAVEFFRSLIPEFYSVSHATKLFRDTITNYSGTSEYIYNTPEHKILYYGKGSIEDLESANENHTLDWL